FSPYFSNLFLSTSSTFSVFPILKAENEVIGKTDLVGFAFQPGLHRGLEPFIEHVMKVDVGEQGTDHLPLSRPRFAQQQSPIFDHSDVDPFPNQSKDSSVTDPFLDHLYEQTSDDRIEVSGNIGFENCRDRSATNDPAYLVQCLLWPTSRTESVGAVPKILLVDRLCQTNRR